MGRPAGKESCCSDPLHQSRGMGIQHKEEKIKPRKWFFKSLSRCLQSFCVVGMAGWIFSSFAQSREKCFGLAGRIFCTFTICVCVPMHAAHAHLFPIAKSTSIYPWKGFSWCFLAFHRFKIRPSRSLCANLTWDFEICWLSLKVKSWASQFWLADGGKLVLNCFKWF